MTTTDPTTPTDEWLARLRAHRAGDPAATRLLFERLYAELREMARLRLARERAGHTLQATSLVHEVYLRLGGADLPALERDAFLRLAATVMRRVLVDSGRRHRLVRRAPAGSTDLATPVEPDAPLERLDAALDDLAARDAELARVVELRFLVGLDVEACAEVLGVSTATVKRAWRTARAFLQQRMEAVDG